MPEEHYRIGNLDELPQQVCEGIVRDIGNFAVAIFGISKIRNIETLTFCGSGTLVSSGKDYYVLTAAHVWTKKIHSSEQMALTLLEGGFHSFRIDTRAVVVDAILGPGEPEEWGPDFCFLRIPDTLVGTIKVYRSFYNLDKRRNVALGSVVDVRNGPWVLMGSPEELGKFTNQQAEFEFPGWFSNVQQVHHRGNLDYLDVGVNTSLPGIPSSFGGVSGAGLWQVPITRSATTGEFSWVSRDVSLEGVAFYQSPVAEGRRIIRCHGRHSIYGNMPDPKVAV